MNLTDDTPVYFVSPQGERFGPEPFSAVCARVDGGQFPANTPIWADGMDWTPMDVLRSGASTPAEPMAPTSSEAVAAAHGSQASDALMAGLSDQELDDEFMGLIKRSWEVYKESEHALSIDEAMLAGIITALVDCGYVLIDLATEGAAPAASTTTTTTTSTAGAAAMTAVVRGHQLRFEEPATGFRVTVELDHLTADAAAAKTLGQLAAVVIGYGERVPNFSQVGQAIRQELAASFIASPEPGTVSWDADMSSGYVYAEIDLILELDRYVDASLDVDQDLLRRHIASVVNTLRTFVRVRFNTGG